MQSVRWEINIPNSLSDAFKMNSEIIPRQAVYEVKIQMYFKYILFAGCHLNVK